MILITILFVAVIDASGKTVIVSADGIDTANCGKSISCRTIDFAITHRAADNDVIKIKSRKSSKDPRPFFIHRSFPIFRNITLLGFNGRPVVSSHTDLVYRHGSSYFFEEKNLEGNKSITLQMKNLILRGIGIARFTEFSSNSKIYFENSHFENITSSKEIIHFEVNPNDLHAISVYFNHCNFTNNVAKNSFSIVNITHCNSVFNKCTFINNNLSRSKGSISLTGANSLFKNSYFEKNIALNGGALYASGDSIIESLNSSFRENNATFSGGAIFTSGNSLIIKQSSFEGNTASGGSGRGGAIFLHAASFCSISESVFMQNKAKIDGGAVYRSGEKKLHGNFSSSNPHNSSIRNNSFTWHNNFMPSFPLVTDSVQKDYLRSIKSMRTLACFAVDKEALKLSGKWKDVGGQAIFFPDSSKEFTLQRKRRFLNGKPSTQGSFLHGKVSSTANQIQNKGNLHVKMSLFKNNIAENGSGGAFYSSDSPDLAISNSFFIENKAKFAGGAVISYKDKLEIKTSLLKKNTALLGGAISSITKKNSLFHTIILQQMKLS